MVKRSFIRMFTISVTMFLFAAGAAPSVGAQTDAQTSTLVAHAAGSTGTELLELQVDGVTISAELVPATGNVFSNAATTTPVEFDVPAGLDYGQIRLAFNNDGSVEGVSRDLRVDRIELDGTTYETNDMVIESTGSFSEGTCRQGFLQSNVLACNGWFQLPAGGGVTGSAVLPTAAPVLPAVVTLETTVSTDQQVEILSLIHI